MVVDSAQEVIALLAIGGLLIGVGRWISRREGATTELNKLGGRVEALEKNMLLFHSDNNNWKNRLMNDLEKKFASREVVEAQLRTISRDVSETKQSVQRMNSALIQVLLKAGHGELVNDGNGS